ncbi:MAG: hypothetical protein ACYSWP_19945 [Planctomycetota bacterium]|jgi:hypothetical protein
MYSSIRLYKVSPGAGVEIARRVNEEFLDIVSKAPGFIRLRQNPVACYRDEWRGEPRRSSKSEGGLASAQFRFDTPQLASGSFICYYVIDAGNDQMASISVFKDQAGAEESNRIASDWVKQNIASLLPGPPEIVAGEVVAHTENT